jgi:hypothetical protein
MMQQKSMWMATDRNGMVSMKVVEVNGDYGFLGPDSM